MPRPRLTLARLMAWIAFAGLNLAVLGVAYRETRPNEGVVLVSAVFVDLVIFYSFAAACRATLRAIGSARRDPARAGQPVETGPYIALFMFGTVAVLTLLPILLLLLVG